MTRSDDRSSHRALRRLGNGGTSKELSISEPLQELLDDLISLYDEGRFEEVVSRVAQSADRSPEAIPLYQIGGKANAALKKYCSAIYCYKIILSIKPDCEEAYNNMGNVLTEMGELEPAIQCYRKAVEIKPDYAEAHSNLGIVLKNKFELDTALYEHIKKAFKIKSSNVNAIIDDKNNQEKNRDLEAARDSLEKAVLIKPNLAEAQHLLASITGKTPRSAPKAYINELFDDYAPKFEQSLVKALGYNVPQELAKIITKKQIGNALGSILDLGCGTGLAGLELRQFCSNLEGIDLSNAMIEQARSKNVYDRLIHGDIVDYLSTAKLDFDYFVATDVFIYVGELTDVFHLIKSRNKRAGHLAFSTEHTEREGFFLETSGRYSHSRAYIEGLCEKFDCRVSHFSKTDLRKEKSDFLVGGLYVVDL